MQSLFSLFHLADACSPTSGIIPSLFDKLTCDGNAPTIGSFEDILIIIGNVVRILLAISGLLAVVLILAASAYYIVSMGDPGRVKRAKDIIQNTVIGLIIMIAAYSLVTFIAGEF